MTQHDVVYCGKYPWLLCKILDSFIYLISIYKKMSDIISKEVQVTLTFIVGNWILSFINDHCITYISLLFSLTNK